MQLHCKHFTLISHKYLKLWPIFFLDLLTVSISPANAEVIRGNSQIITCTVSGNPSVTNVAWTKDGQSVNVAGNPTKYSGGTPGNPSLTVTNFETTDAGSYVCIATNAVGSQSSSTSVLTYIGRYYMPAVVSIRPIEISDFSNLPLWSTIIYCYTFIYTTLFPTKAKHLKWGLFGIFSLYFLWRNENCTEKQILFVYFAFLLYVCSHAQMLFFL